MCSNPDCRRLTSGPNSDARRSTILGEAAHIYGARVDSPRYRSDMTDGTRAEISNGIWLCRNCHKLVDSDANRFPAELLFRWRELHEQYVSERQRRSGNHPPGQSIEHALVEFAEDSPLARRYISDRVVLWEYRLTAELLVNYLKPPLRKWHDLSSGLYYRSKMYLSDDEYLDWLCKILNRAGELASPTAKLLNAELKRAWGSDGEPGDPGAIKHVCRLITNVADNIVSWEEDVQFVSVPEKFRAVHALLPGVLGAQLDQFEMLPKFLNEVVDWVELNPDGQRHFHHSFVMDVPPGWEERLHDEIARVT